MAQARNLMLTIVICGLPLFISGCRSITMDSLKTPESLDAQSRLKDMSLSELHKKQSELVRTTQNCERFLRVG